MLSQEYGQNRYKHAEDQNIPDEYTVLSLHIALERADTNKDWVTFKKIYSKSPVFLKQHLIMTSINYYNYQKLDKQQKEEMLKIEN
jgi:hypothetical protein